MQNPRREIAEGLENCRVIENQLSCVATVIEEKTGMDFERFIRSIQPLELNVIDNYQACEIRSTRNLSGGASFMVSLTLALGLSKIASLKVRVDSLLLDQRFSEWG